MCQMIVVSSRMTAIRAMVAPRRRLSRLNHSRSQISFRAPDRGSNSATATPLVLVGMTNIFATTPETDPANTNTANKGVIETNTNVDVFSFQSGNGAINLTVNPWIMPGGTRGGNLDLLVE